LLIKGGYYLAPYPESLSGFIGQRFTLAFLVPRFLYPHLASMTPTGTASARREKTGFKVIQQLMAGHPPRQLVYLQYKQVSQLCQ